MFNRQNNKTNSTLHIDIGLETVTDRSISWEYKMSHIYATMNYNLFCYMKYFERLKVICRHLMPQNNAYTQTRLTATWLYFCGVYKNLRYYCNILFSGHIITDNACFVSEIDCNKKLRLHKWHFLRRWPFTYYSKITSF